MLAAVVNSSLWQSQPTYRWEYMVAASYLFAVTVGSTDWSDRQQALGQVIGACAVFATFCHMSVAARLEEAQDRSDTKTVECYRKLTYYLISKELLWLAAFMLLGAWTALAGIPLFLAYPAWRRAFLRARLPPQQVEQNVT